MKIQVYFLLKIVGPMANNTDGIFGGYSPEPDPKYIKTPLQGLQGLGTTTQYHIISFLAQTKMFLNFLGKKWSFAEGCQDSDTHCGNYDSNSVKEAAQGSDLVVVCLGTGAAVEQEGNDRSDIELPGHQSDLLEDAISAGALAKQQLKLI